MKKPVTSGKATALPVHKKRKTPQELAHARKIKRIGFDPNGSVTVTLSTVVPVSGSFNVKTASTFMLGLMAEYQTARIAKESDPIKKEGYTEMRKAIWAELAARMSAMAKEVH